MKASSSGELRTELVLAAPPVDGCRHYGMGGDQQNVMLRPWQCLRAAYDRRRDLKQCGVCGGELPSQPGGSRMCRPCAEDFYLFGLWC